MLIRAEAMSWSSLPYKRGAEAHGRALGHQFDDRAAGRTGLAHLVEIFGPGLDGLGVRAEERIAPGFLPVPVGAVQAERPHLHQGAADGDRQE